MAGDSQTGLTDEFNTELSPEDEKKFKDWVATKSKAEKRDVSQDLYDYDLRGAFKAGVTPDGRGHLPDTFKKPNHPTMSDESIHADENNAGHWDGNTYTPSKNVSEDQVALEKLIHYFSENEPDAKLVIKRR